IVFGAGKLPEIGSVLGRSTKEFKVEAGNEEPNRVLTASGVRTDEGRIIETRGIQADQTCGFRRTSSSGLTPCRGSQDETGTSGVPSSPSKRRCPSQSPHWVDFTLPTLPIPVLCPTRN
ncbi:MAG TPA: twin-arginine translocase TatA/TatE family subunit, partial [Chloroflexota bacterium]|nr:twin-arginine translocase TatA/TatE family subunit [Chloroflexota bacterium]